MAKGDFITEGIHAFRYTGGVKQKKEEGITISAIIEEIARERSDIKVGEINVDGQPELASQFRVMSIPALVAMRSGGITGQTMGARPKSQILAML